MEPRRRHPEADLRSRLDGFLRRLKLPHVQIMGILNVTPDSFSDGGVYADPAAATARAVEMVKEGADIIDIGGESTRPGSGVISSGEEAGRVVPVVEAVAAAVDVPISIDTRKAAVAVQALEAGAVIVNDISALSFDAGMRNVVKSCGAAVILMHMQGTPETMQDEPHYHDVAGEVVDYLRKASGRAVADGIAREKIVVDPGIGFGKTVGHNCALIRGLRELAALGYPVCVGVSRKRFIGTLLNIEAPQDRLYGSIAAQCVAVLNGARIIRTHDVRAAKESLRLVEAICLTPHGAKPRP